MQYGYDMKRKHGPDFRRNVRFEDAEHTFVIDMLIPGKDNPKNEWITVCYDRVLADRKGRAKDQERGNDSRLCSSTTGQDLPSTGSSAYIAEQAGSGAGMGTTGTETDSLPSTGGPAGAAGQAGSGAGMGSTWGSYRSN